MSRIKSIKPSIKKSLPTQETKRKCNICDEPITDNKSSLFTNRDAGYGNIGRAHDSCIAKRLGK